MIFCCIWRSTSAGNLTRKISSASSLSTMEESDFLRTSLGSSDNLFEHRTVGEGIMSPYYMKSVTSSTFEAALRQKEGELASYTSRLVCNELFIDWCASSVHFSNWRIHSFVIFIQVLALCTLSRILLVTVVLILFRLLWSPFVILLLRSWLKWLHRWDCRLAFDSSLQGVHLAFPFCITS